MKKVFILFSTAFLISCITFGSVGEKGVSNHLKASKIDVFCTSFSGTCGAQATLCIYNPNGPISLQQLSRAGRSLNNELCGTNY